jgi:phosphoribosylformylglycinamidine synthase
MERNPYWGACSAVDEVCRNLISVGAKPDSLLDCLNFGNPEKPERMGEFYEACRGIGDMARSLSLPFISGNVSFYNESIKTAVPPTPLILGLGIAADIRKCITSDFKEEGNLLYLVGKQTENEMGGSEYYNVSGIDGGKIPRTNAKILKNCMNGILSSIEKTYLLSCHDISEGGIGVCFAEMAIGGNIGGEIDLSNICIDLRTDFKLFSESNTRWLTEVKQEKYREFELLLTKHHSPFKKIGKTKGNNIIVNDKKRVIHLSIEDIRHSWKSPIWSLMG